MQVIHNNKINFNYLDYLISTGQLSNDITDAFEIYIDDIPAFIDLIKSSNYGVDLIHIIDIDPIYKSSLMNADFKAKIYAALFEKYNDLDYFHKSFKVSDTLPKNVKNFIESKHFLSVYHPERMAFINEYIKHNNISNMTFDSLPFFHENKQLKFIVDNIYNAFGKLDIIKYLGGHIKKFVAIKQIHIFDYSALKTSIYDQSIMALLDLMDVSVDAYNEALNENFDIKASLLKVTGLTHLYESIQLLDIQDKPFDIYSIIKNDVAQIDTIEWDLS